MYLRLTLYFNTHTYEYCIKIVCFNIYIYQHGVIDFLFSGKSMVSIMFSEDGLKKYEIHTII